ncbi:MAG: 30S ribosome-binding factor RbfA [Planctomycetota bacterium]
MRFRKQRVESVVQRVVGEAITHRMNDPRIGPLTTVSRVQLTGDLTIATVYLTVLGGAPQERKTIAAMRHAGGYLQRLVAEALQLRQCPELRFEIDETARKVKETMLLLDENRRKRGEEPVASAPGGDAHEDPLDPDGAEGLQDEIDEDES